ncbi:TolC family protein [Comamonas endophytica]|uniref:TolC family protein n=1 Tax=Comamonas endophytica TaxID=2949090 RepID=A0ABY6GEJ3_9BURK|nr:MULTISPECIES: TolC family protein [unclassified Acidovorax]MCD2513134.1 TolC family protein [Acidovorax sp. D4N7]UYG53516.1 TolC family protein [Acidovorax sp. 5MLIR]
MANSGRGWMLCALLLACGAPAAAQPVDGLQAALQAALGWHPAINGKQAQIKAREYSADAARAQRLPTLSFQAQQYGSGNGDSASGAGSSLPTTLRARQPLWAFGRIDSAIALADAETTRERVDLLRVRRDLLDRTSRAYARVLGSRALLAVAQANLAAHRDLLAQIQRRQTGQLASVADVRLATTRMSQAQARADRYLGDLEIAQSDLRALTRVELAAEQPVPEGLLALGDAAMLRQAALDNSAEIRLKRQEIDLAAAGVEQASKASMPTLYMQADKDHGRAGYREAVRVSLVFEATLEGMGYAAGSRTGAAIARQQAAEDGLADTTNEIERSVRSLQRSRQLQEEMIEVQGATLGELQEVLASYQRQYVAGSKSWLEVLNFQRELSEQQLQLAQARSDWTLLSLQLAALVGGLDPLVESEMKAF